MSSSACLITICMTMTALTASALGADEAPAECKVALDTTRIVAKEFGGVGFHAFFPLHETDDEHYEKVLTARWRELRPSFARLTHRWLDGRPGQRDEQALDRIVRACKMMAQTHTQIYLTTWNPLDAPAGEPRAAYAAAVVDELEYLIRERDCTNIRWYCMTNELSLNGWGKLREDLTKFKDYHRLIHAELRKRKLDVQLLATDASPIWAWSTIEWAAANMDAVTGAYGGHHYINRHHPSDTTFYPWFLERLTWGAAQARAKGKPFIIGEFGAKQYKGPPKNGKRWDACHWWNTPVEPLVGVQVAEAIIAGVNAGVYAIGYWTFTDFPDTFASSYANRWGVFQWKDHDNRIRPHYFALGLLTRSFQRGMTVVKADSSDPLVRVAAATDPKTGRWTVAVVNRNDKAAPFECAFVQGGPKSMTKTLYDPAAPPMRTDGRLQAPAATLPVADGVLRDTLAPGVLVVYE